MDAKIINRHIEQSWSALFQAYLKLKAEKKLITVQLIKARFLGAGPNKQTVQGIINTTMNT